MVKGLKQKIFNAISMLYRGFGGYKKQILFLTFLGFFSSLFEGVGINALVPLFSFVTGQGQGGDDSISRFIKESFLILHIPFSVRYLLIFISLLFVLKAILLLWGNYISIKVTSGYEQNTRSSLFAKALRASWPYLLNQRLGHLETVLMTNIRTNSQLLGYLSIIVISSSTLIVYSLIALNISAYITLITLCLSSLIFFLYKPFIDKLRKISYEEEQINRQIAHHVNENIYGMKTIKSMGAEENVIGKARDYFKRLRDIRIKSFILSSLSGSLMEPASLIFICILFAFSYKTPNFNLAAFAAVIYLIKQIFANAQQLQKYVLGINTLLPYLRSVVSHQEIGDGGADEADLVRGEF